MSNSVGPQVHLAAIWPDVPLNTLPYSARSEALPRSTLIFNVRNLADLSWLNRTSRHRLVLFHIADEQGTSDVLYVYDDFGLVFRDYYFDRSFQRYASRRSRIVMLGAHTCAGTPLKPQLQAYSLLPMPHPGTIFGVTAPLPMSARPIMCAWAGFDHAGGGHLTAARDQLRAFLANNNSDVGAWARSNCLVTFNSRYAAGGTGTYFAQMSQSVFYLNPEGNTRAVDNIRWGEIMAHAAIPINVDTGEHAHGNRSIEGFSVFSGKPPPGIYATSWKQAFEQAMALAARPGALQELQDDIVVWRRRMLCCLRADAKLILAMHAGLHDASQPSSQSRSGGRSASPNCEAPSFS